MDKTWLKGVVLALSAIVMMAVFPLVGAAEEPYWIKSYGTTGWDEILDAAVLDDGSIVAVGVVTDRTKDSDVLVMKLSPYGTLEWARKFGGDGKDIGMGVTIAANGDIIVVGYTSSFGAGESDVLLLRLDSDGKLEWAKTYGGESNETASKVEIANDGKIVVVGSTRSYGADPGKSSDLWVLKLTGKGEVVWAKTYGRNSWDIGYDVKTDSHGYIYIGGSYWMGEPVENEFRAYYRKGNAWLLKLDSSGNIVWNKVIQGVDDDWIYSIDLLPDGGLVFLGITKSYGAGNFDILAGRTDENGDVVWMRTYGGRKRDTGIGIAQFSGTCAIITGSTWSFGAGGMDAWILSVSVSDGKVGWEKTYGGTGHEGLNWVTRAKEGFLTVGFTETFGVREMDGWVLKLPMSGEVFKAGIKDDGLKVGSNDEFSYKIEPNVVSPNVIVKDEKPTVKSIPISGKPLALKVGVQYYYGPEPPETTTTTTTTTTSSTTTTTSQTSSTSTSTSHTSTTSTVTTTTTTTTTHTTTHTETTTETHTGSTTTSGGGGICGPGLIVLLGVGIVATRRRL